MTSPILAIPAHNPTHRLIDLVQQLTTALSNPTIIVVNDGSPKKSNVVFETLQCKFNITLLTHSKNLGKGAALKTIFNYCLTHHHSTSGIITMDADGQHLIKDIITIHDKFINDAHAFWIGSRTFSSSTPFRSRIGNQLTAFIFKKLFHVKLPDTQSGLRAIPTYLLSKLLTLTTNGFEFELEMLILVVKNKIPIKTIPMETVYIEKNKQSNFNPIIDSIKIYRVFLSYLMKKN